MAVTKRTGLSEGPHFSAKYTVLLNKWRTRLPTTLNREVANCIIEGARNARGGERLDSNSVVAGSLHLFESSYTAEAVRLVSTFNLRLSNIL